MADKRKPGFAPAPDPNARYRVRDRHEPNAPGYLWGENLSLEEAHKLKELVAGTGKSKTVRYEPMSEPYPPGSASTKPVAKAVAPVAPRAPQRQVVTVPPKPAAPKLTAEQQAKLDKIRGERQADPRLEQIRQTALGVAHGAAQAAQERHEQVVAAQKTAELADEAGEAAEDAGGMTDEDFQSIVGDLEGEPTPEEIAAAQAEFEAEEAAKADGSGEGVKP